MPDAFEEQAVLVAAEQAAAEGDTIAAEMHLRKLLDLQTARLGPDHAEVASTLHNLAVVCERAGRIGEAEGLYRRAYTVAVAALPPTDSLVVRCLDDLNAFLDARSMPRQPSASAAPPTPPRAAPASGVRKPSPSAAARPAARPPSRVRPPAPAAPPPSAMPWRSIGVAVAVIAAAALGWLVFGRGADAPAPEPSAAPVAAAPAKRPPAKKATPPTGSPAETPAPPAASPGVAATPAAAPAPPESTPVTPPPAAEAPAAEPAESAADAGAIAVTDARLCGQLSTAGGWTCTAPDTPFNGGRLYFLTRLTVPQTMQVEHRWLHGEAVVQAVRLRIQAGGRAGYRTYSRQTVDAARTGDWRVELRAPDGALLAEERFVVQ